MQFSSIWPIDRTLSGTTTLDQSGPGSNGNEGVLCIPQSFSITGASPSDCFVSCTGTFMGGGLTPLQRCCWGILQPQPTGQTEKRFTNYNLFIILLIHSEENFTEFSWEISFLFWEIYQFKNFCLLSSLLVLILQRFNVIIIYLLLEELPKVQKFKFCSMIYNLLQHGFLLTIVKDILSMSLLPSLIKKKISSKIPLVQ